MHSLGVVVVAWTLALCAVREWPLALASYSALAPASNEVREYYVREELPAGSLVCNLVVDLQLHERYDPATVAKLRFSFLTRPQHFDQDYFLIDERSGEIHTAVRLDRESMCPGGVIDCVAQYDVAIKPIEYFQIVKVKIEVTDVNDHVPEFPKRKIQHSIAESMDPESSGIPIPAAVDNDSGKNAIRTYELKSKVDKFELIQRQTADGATDLRLVLKDKLDREIKDEYQLTVVAIDGGDPPKSGSIVVEIKVLDVNDNAPIFDNNATYEIRVPEDLPAGSTVQKVRAKDADAGLNGAITYSFSPLTERQHGKIFGIRPDTGKIYVKPAMQLSSPPFSPMDPWSSAASSATGSGALDHEAASVHLLSVVAVDRGQDPLTAHATVIVRVDDVNDNSPNIRVNTLVQPSAASGGETSGVGRPVASVAARAQLVENAAPGTFVAYVSVSDPDSGDYGRFWCSVTTSGLGGLRSENDVNDYPFALRQTFPPSDFQLVAVISLDREQQAAYDVTITCSDAGGRTSTSVVRVEVVDENDNGPVFSRESRYEFEIEENCPIGTIVGRVSASDIDDGPNAEVEYRLSGPELLTNRFVIDRRSGSISTRDDIDREYLIRESTAAATDNSRSDVNSDALKLTVVASDGGTPHRTSTADIIIHIGDVDDERPTFDAEQYTFHVAENQPSGATVGRVHAIDRDMPPNNRFRYFLTDHRRPSSVPSVGDSSVYFDVDELTGVLSTRIEFNRERIAEYHFDVVAKPDVVDDGTAGFETIVCVTVLVDDVNDVSPMFVSPLSDNQTILVSSRAPKRHVITTLRAVDHDAPGSHNSALTYGIISGGELLFAVNPHNGKLWVTGYLGDIVMREFLLRLIVSDNGLPFARNDTTELRIVVSRDVAYVPYPVDPYDDEITSDKYKLQDQYGGVLASEATAAVLAVALAIILTAIFVVAVTICVVRHRARSRRGILLVADGPRCTSADCCDEKDKRRHRAKSDKNGGLRGRPSQSAGDGQPRGMTEFTSTMTDADGMVSAARQSGGCAGHDVTTSGTLMPLVNGAAVTSLDISHLPDGDLMSVHQAPSVCSSGRYSADCGRSGSPLHCGPSLISSGGGSTTATTGTSSFSLGALQTSYGANQQHRQQPMRTAPARYLPLADHTHDVGLECDGIQMQAAASITNEESVVDRKPVVVFVKDLNQHPPLPVSAGLLPPGVASHRPHQHRLLDIERDSVGSASNTDSGNGNSSEYSGPESDPSPPMMTSSIATANIANANLHAAAPSGCAASISAYSLCSHQSAAAAFSQQPSDVQMMAMLTKPHGAVPSPNPASLSGFQTLPSRGLGQRRTSVGSAAACASGRVPASSSSYYRGTYHSNSGVTTSASGAVDHVISRCDYENVDMLSSMVPRRDPVGIRGSISDVTPETDVVHRAARCRIYQQQQPQPHPLPSKMTNDAGAIEYGNLGSRSLGRSLQDLPDTNV